MLKMVIVDDEAIIRKGIRSSIDWQNYDINIIAEAANGIEALQKIIQIKPDIVIMDIRMPQLDGLEVCKKIKKELPELEIIILSGYDEFAYAQKAIELGVADYLLKPFGADELVDIVNKLKDKITKKKSIKEERELVHKNSREISSIIVNKIIRGEELQIDYKNNLGLLGSDLSKEFYHPFIVDIDYSLLDDYSRPEKLEQTGRLFIDVFYEKYSGHGFLVPIVNEQYLFGTLNLDSTISIDEFTEIKEEMGKESQLPFTIFVGDSFTDFEGLRPSYEQLSSSLIAKFYTGGDTIISNPAMIVNTFKGDIKIPQSYKKIGDYLNFMEKNNLFNELDELFGFISTEHLKVSLVKHIIIDVNKNLIDIIDRSSEEMEEIITIEDMIKVINQIDTLSVLEVWQCQMIDYYFDILSEIRGSKYNSIVNKAIRFMNVNYQKDISLEMISDYVHVSPNYFSKIFKKETGSNFVDWLNSLRVNKSKEILAKTDKKCSLIAEEVGYNDYRYFSFNFKKYTNMTPRKYRKKINQS
ncbi:MAG: response regulator transcription factor [Bacillota bacterium]